MHGLLRGRHGWCIADAMLVQESLNHQTTVQSAKGISISVSSQRRWRL